MINVPHTMTVIMLVLSLSSLQDIETKKIFKKSETHLHNIIKLNYKIGDGRRKLHVLLSKHYVLTNV